MLKISQIRKKSIKNQLIIDFGAILLSVCVISYIAVYCIFSDLLKKNQEDTTDVVTDVVISQARTMINTVGTIIDKVANIELLQDTIVPIEERLKAVETNVPIMYQLGLFDKDGNGMVSTGKKINIKGKAVFDEALLGEIDSFTVTTYDGQDYISFLRPVLDKQGEAQSVVLAFHKLEDFFQRIMQVSRGEICYIVNSEGIAFWGRIDEDGVSKCGRVTDTKGFEKLFENDMLYDQEYTLKTKELYSGEDVEVTYSLVGEPSWIIGVVRLEKASKQALNVFHTAMLWGMFLVLIVGMIIVYIIVSSISKRMNGIASYLGNSIKSEFKETMPPELLKDDDEIGKIAKEVKHLEEEMVEMLDSIKTSIDYLNNIK